MATKPPAPAAAPTPAELDAHDAGALVEAAERAIKAIESIRSRMVGKRDATAATGHLLEAIATAGGSLREYDRRHVWALRHALGAESSSFRQLHEAASYILSVAIQSLRAPQSDDEAARQKSAHDDMIAMSKILQASEHSFEATKNVEQHDAGLVAAKAQADKLAHEARMALGASGTVTVLPATPAPKAAQKSGPKPTAPDGDYALEGSVDAPGGNPFPTAPVG